MVDCLVFQSLGMRFIIRQETVCLVTGASVFRFDKMQDLPILFERSDYFARQVGKLNIHEYTSKAYRRT